MHIAHYTTRRPVATAMFFLACILLGVVSFVRLPVDLLPDVSFPRLLIWTAFRDVGPVEIEEFVTIPVEEAVSTVAGVRNVHSISRGGLSLVTVEFAWGTEMDFAALTLREKLDNLRHSFSPQVERPVILRADPRARPVMTLAVSGGSNLHSLYTLTRDVFKRRLEQIDGVAIATVTGGQQREIQIDLDMQRLTALAISLQEIENTLQLANDSRTGGSIKKGRYRYALRTMGEFQSVDDIAETVISIKTGNNGDATDVRLGDLATITDGYRERQGMTRVNGSEAIGLLVTKEAGANTVRVCAEVLDVIEQLRVQYPEIELTVVDNQADFISGAIAQVRQALILGGILAFIVLFFFLHDLRNPINIAISMPVSVATTFALMYFSGVSLNMVSLGGLALGVGMLVDNSIVVLENIFRREQACPERNSMALQEAAVEGTREVSLAITASTLTTIAVFFPILYIEGVAGQLFGDQAKTVAYSLLVSLVVAMALLPMIAARWQRGYGAGEQGSGGAGEQGSGGAGERGSGGAGEQGGSSRWRLFRGIRKLPVIGIRFLRGLLRFWGTNIGSFLHKITDPLFRAFDAAFAKLTVRYESWLEAALERPRKVLLVTAVVFVLAVIPGLQIDRRLMPEVEQGRFTIAVNLPPGSTLQASSELTAQIEHTVQSLPDVESVFAQIGIVEGDLRQVKARIGEHVAEIHLFLKQGRKTESVIRKLQLALASFGGEAITLQKPQTAIGEILGTSLADLAVQVRGNDPDSARLVMAALREKLVKIPGVARIFSSEEEKRPEVRLVVDREKASAYDVAPGEIAAFIEGYMHGRIATDFKDFDRKIPILLRADARQRQRLEDLLDTPINVSGRAVPLSQVVKIEQQMAPAVIEREGQVRQRTLFLSVVGRGYNAVANEVEKLVAGTTVPYGFEIKLGGQRREMLESFREMSFAFLLAFALVFMILAAQFESLLHPFTIILAVPLALIGVVIGLLATGQSFNIMSLIGIVVLVGIVVNDAIIKVDFINQERKRGTALREAILLAGQKRLRPILMTTITTVLGLLPMAIGFGEGAELRRPLAIAVIFGLSFATVLTLVVVPVLYQGLAGRAGERESG